MEDSGKPSRSSLQDRARRLNYILALLLCGEAQAGLAIASCASGALFHRTWRHSREILHEGNRTADRLEAVNAPLRWSRYAAMAALLRAGALQMGLLGGLAAGVIASARVLAYATSKLLNRMSRKDHPP